MRSPSYQSAVPRTLIIARTDYLCRHSPYLCGCVNQVADKWRTQLVTEHSCSTSRWEGVEKDGQMERPPIALYPVPHCWFASVPAPGTW